MGVRGERPVTLPPGCARRATNPFAIRSPAFTTMIGIVVVTFLAARGSFRQRGHEHVDVQTQQFGGEPAPARMLERESPTTDGEKAIVKIRRAVCCASRRAAWRR